MGGLPNRVRPDGQLVINPARGLFTGNRGVIHDPDTKSLNGRRWSTPAWICCSLSWKGRKRDVWGKNYRRRDGTKGAGWSEIFFLDEVTALAAGHRPCHTCRNGDAKAFHEGYCAANGMMDASAKNKLLHAERWHSRKTPPTQLSVQQLLNFPNGAMIKTGDLFMAKRGDNLLPWDFEGYGTPQPIFEDLQAIQLVTPLSIIGALREGYNPVWHESAPS